MINELYEQAIERQKTPKSGSYTTYLFEKGLDKILKKVGEEATEVVVAAKNADKAEINKTGNALGGARKRKTRRHSKKKRTTRRK